MDWLRRHEAHPIAETPVRDWVKWDSNQSVEDYARRMRVGGWGGGVEMAAFARLFDVDVHVWERAGASSKYPFKRISRFDRPGGAGGPPVDVLYRGGVHYDALIARPGALVELEPGAPSPRVAAPSPRSPLAPVGPRRRPAQDPGALRRGPAPRFGPERPAPSYPAGYGDGHRSPPAPAYDPRRGVFGSKKHYGGGYSRGFPPSRPRW